jgi:ribosomal-protein-alanine N-acetyltransferase
LKHLKAGIATLRPYRPGDCTSLAISASNQKISVNLRDSFPFPYTLKDAREWISLVISQETLLNFAIAEPLNRVIGGIGLTPGHGIHRQSVELGYWVREDYWNRGIATAGVKAITEYAISELGFIRVFAMVFSKNWPSRSVLEKNGYILEGILRNHVTKCNKVLDMAVYSVISTDTIEGKSI